MLTNLDNSVEGSVKILGVHLDPHLNFKYQMQLVAAKLKSCLYGMRNLRPLVDKSTILKIYHGFFRGNINYFVPFMSMCNASTLDPIIKADKAAMRIVENLDFRASTSGSFKALGILSVEKCIKLYIYKFMYKYSCNLQPKSFDEYWTTNLRRQAERNLRNVGDFQLPPKLKPQILWTHPLYKFPKMYNQLNNDLKHVSKLSTFVKLTKEFLLVVITTTPPPSVFYFNLI